MGQLWWASGWVALLALSGCWKDDYAAIPPGVLRFQPAFPDAPRGFVVAPLVVPLTCPDGERARFYVMYPARRDDPDAPMPLAVVYHSGSFDFVFAPDATDPLAGTHYSDPPRLSGEWAINQVFATLGMYPVQTPGEVHDGRLLAALAAQGVAALLPTGCWGDLWGNRRGGFDNTFGEDFFFRDGKAAAEWAYRFAVDPVFAAAFDAVLPIPVDPEAVYAIGLGEGGRAVAELLSLDADEDGVPDFTPAGVLVDSSPDDLRVYFADAGLYASEVEGLTRLFPTGVAATEAGSLWAAPLPDRTAFLSASLDPALPSGLHDAVLARLGGPQWAFRSDEPVHVLSNGGSQVPDLAASAVTYLLTGIVPAATVVGER